MAIAEHQVGIGYWTGSRLKAKDSRFKILRDVPFALNLLPVLHHFSVIFTSQPFSPLHFEMLV
jgi:hypothetical protein